MLSVHLDTLGSDTLRAGPGVLHSLVIERPGSNDARVVLRDGARVLADVRAGGPSVTVGAIPYGLPFNGGLSVERAGAAAPVITVVFRSG